MQRALSFCISYLILMAVQSLMRLLLFGASGVLYFGLLPVAVAAVIAFSFCDEDQKPKWIQVIIASVVGGVLCGLFTYVSSLNIFGK